VEKCGTAREATDDSIVRRREDAICRPNTYGKNTDTHTFIVLIINHVTDSRKYFVAPEQCRRITLWYTTTHVRRANCVYLS
jgi:hypothetical protein